VIPTGAAQLLVILGAVIPGFVYQITRRALRGHAFAFNTISAGRSSDASPNPRSWTTRERRFAALRLTKST